MKPINALLDATRDAVRSVMLVIARGLNRFSGGRITPNMVTLVGLMAHIPIALLITNDYLVHASLLLIIFGLFDTLDGALARLQGKANNAGMLLDAVTDRMKEVILYMGVGAYFVRQYFFSDQMLLFEPDRIAPELLIALTIAAAGGSLLVSYVKAKGETAVAGQLSANEVNRLFQDGFMRFELRMFALVVGLFFGFEGLVVAIILIALLSWATAIERLLKISRKLRDV